MLYPFNYGDVKPGHYTHFCSVDKHLTTRLLKVSPINRLRVFFAVSPMGFWPHGMESIVHVATDLGMTNEGEDKGAADNIPR